MKVSVLQYDVKKDIYENINTIKRLTQGINADILLLPELSMSGYLFKDRNELSKYAVNIPSDAQELLFLKELSLNNNCAVIAGIAEIDGDKIYNSAVVFERGTYIGKYRKTHLSNFEKHFFDSLGSLDDNIGIFNICKITVGVQICFDLWFPEISRRQILNSADLICVCANFGVYNTFNMVSVHSMENQTPIILSNRVGEERSDEIDAYFLGKSTITDKYGNHIAEADENKEEIISADIEITHSKSNVICSDFISEIKRHYK